jgi:hypothetical protein
VVVEGTNFAGEEKYGIRHLSIAHRHINILQAGDSSCVSRKSEAESHAQIPKMRKIENLETLEFDAKKDYHENDY